MSRTYVIADLHGRLDLLSKAHDLIRKHGRDPMSDHIVTLGDYVDRGPQSRQVIAFLMSAQQFDPLLICLKGNHEDIMLQTCLGKVRSAEWWIGNGGGETLKSYGHPKTRASNYGQDVHVGVVPQEHLRWIGSLPLYLEDEHRVYVHAGVPDDRPMEEQPEERLTWMLYSKNDFGGYRGKHVVHGHHQFADGPHVWRLRTDLDTHAYKTGRLVVGVFDDDKPGGAVEFIEVKI